MLCFDCIRVIACTMIVLMHSPMPGLGTPNYVLSGISYTTAPGIGLFFMISGALIIDKAEKNMDYFSFYIFLKHRLSKTLIPLFSWILICNVASHFGIEIQQLGVLWFLWTISGLYILTPILVRWLHHASNGEICTYLCIWFMTLCIPYTKQFINVNEGINSWMYYFHGYVGYYVLGFYIHTHRKAFLKTHNLVVLCSLFVIFSIAMPLYVLFFGLNVNFYEFFWYLSPSIALLSTAWFILFVGSTRFRVGSFIIEKKYYLCI